MHMPYSHGYATLYGRIFDFSAIFYKIDRLTPLMTFDPDEKKIHMYTGKMHCSNFNQKILRCSVLEINIFEVF